MKRKTICFGFVTPSLEALNEDLARNNGGVLPGPGQIESIAITAAWGAALEVCVTLYQ